jgi:Secretion system C-terminal sorting domain
MKKIIFKISIIAIFSGVMLNKANAQNDADPAVTSCSFANSPIQIGQETFLCIFVTNAGFTTNVASGSIGLQITLPVTAEYKSYPESIAAISGDYAGKFNWTYNSTTKVFTGTLNSDILPGDGGMILFNVKGNQTGNSIPSAADLLLLNPPAYPNDNNTNNDLAASMSVTSGTLPISLLSFNAVKQTNAVKLNWETSTEINSNYFDVLASSNGVNWKSIGTVKAAGNSSIKQQYLFTDNAPVKGMNYYRLKMVDIDAKFGYSLTRTVGFSTGSTLTIQPNPTTDRVYITSDDIANIKYVAVYSSEGKLMNVVNNFATGNSIDMQTYAPGVYLLKIIYKDDHTETERIVKK